jgi:hypothetical protein
MYISIDLQVARVDSMWIAGKCALLNASTADTQEARLLFQFPSPKQEKTEHLFLPQETLFPNGDIDML